MINFTNRDFNTIKADLINQLKSMSDKWNDTNESDASMIFINTLAGISAMLNFYIDKQCNESYINLAKEDKNVLSLLELLNYKRPLRVPARATQVFEKVSTEGSSTDTVNSISIKLPKYTALSGSRSGNIPYMLNEPLVMLQNETYKEVEIIQGSRQSYVYKRKDITGYKLHLPKGGISEEDFVLLIDGAEWIKCDNAFLKYRGGRYYSLHRDAYDSHYILLSCDFDNYIYDDSEIEVRYTECLGEYIDPPNTVVSLSNSTYSSYLNTYNKDYFTGGFTEDDVLLDRAKIQASCRVLDKLVRLEDYEYYISNYPGVISSKCIDWSIKDAMNINAYQFRDVKPYQIICYLILDNENVSEKFLDKLEKDIKEKQVYSNDIVLVPAVRVSKSIKIKIKTKSKFVNKESLKELVYNTIKDLYQQKSLDKGIQREAIYSKVLSKTNEIYTMDIIEPVENTYPSLGEYFEVDYIDVEVD